MDGKRLRNSTGKRQISVRYHSLTCNTAALSKGAYRGKNLKNDTETLHQNSLSAYIREKRRKEPVMARMSNKRRLEWSFFLNDRSRITYNELCRKCQHECKQSFRAVVVDCPKYLSKRSKKKDKTAGNGKIP